MAEMDENAKIEKEDVERIEEEQVLAKTRVVKIREESEEDSALGSRVVKSKWGGTISVKFKKPIVPSARHTAGKLIKPCDIPLEETEEADKWKKNEGAREICRGNNEMQGGKAPPLSYEEPTWAGRPGPGYSMEVLKSGVIIDTLSLVEKSFYLIGRLPSSDFSLAHPTISRHHAILQYRSIDEKENPIGFYLYDLGSTHGTFWNGSRIQPYVYVRVHGGHMLKFGCSQRKYILQAPLEDHEAESEYTVTQLKERRQLELQTRLASEQAQTREDERQGIDWGMGEDADETTDLQENPFASINDEDLVLDDPKKTLRGWFEREGYDLQYHTEERGIGQFLCWINLPLENITSRSVRAEALVKGKKKECVVQCALEACKILDKYGLLRQANHEARKRKTRNWEEEDYYDSDEDNFLDRTGSVEKKREQRMRLAGKLETKVETHDSLLLRQQDIVKRIFYLTNSLDNSPMESATEADTPAEADALDTYMSKLTSCALSKSDIAKMKLELQTLRREQEKLVKLLDLTRPANLPPLSEEPTTSTACSTSTSRTQLSAKITCGVFKDRADRESGSFAMRAIPPHIERRIEDVQLAEEGEVVAEAQAERLVAVSDYNETEKVEKDEKYEQEEREEQREQIESNERGKKSHRKRQKLAQVIKCNSNEAAMDDIQCGPSRVPKHIKQSHRKREKAIVGEGGVSADNYSTWIPPKDQQGDGRTKLNDKYGY